MKIAARISLSSSCAPAILCLSIALGCATRAQVPAESDRPLTQSAAAVNQAGLRAQVDALLSDLDGGTTDADWKKLGAGAMTILEQIFNDAAESPFKRTRAVDSLAQVDNPEASDRLKAILADSNVGTQYRSTAAWALGRREGASAAHWLHPRLGDPNRSVREAVIRTLASVGGEEARKSLEERLPKEEDPKLREFIQRTLIKIQP